MTALNAPTAGEPYALPPALLAAALDVDPARGLTTREAQRRSRVHGRNEIRRSPPRALIAILADQFRSLITVLLGAAAALSVAFQRWTEAMAILAVILANAAIGFFTEWRAVRSMEALRGLTVHRARVRRGGSILEVPAGQLVPGDVVHRRRGCW